MGRLWALLGGNICFQEGKINQRGAVGLWDRGAAGLWDWGAAGLWGCGAVGLWGCRAVGPQLSRGLKVGPAPIQPRAPTRPQLQPGPGREKASGSDTRWGKRPRARESRPPSAMSRALAPQRGRAHGSNGEPRARPGLKGFGSSACKSCPSWCLSEKTGWAPEKTEAPKGSWGSLLALVTVPNQEWNGQGEVAQRYTAH